MAIGLRNVLPERDTMSATVAADPIYAVSDAERQAYSRDGAVLLKRVLQGPALARLARGLDAVHADPDGRFTRVKGADGEGLTVIGQCSSLANPDLAALVLGGGLARIAAELMGVSSAQLVLDQMFYKEAGRIVPTPWHQDTPFLCVRGIDMARVWVSADPSPRAVTVQLVRGSHRWNVVYDTRSDAQSGVAMPTGQSRFFYDGIGDARLPPSPDIERWRDSFDILTFDVEPGDAVVFQGNMLHGAGGAAHFPHARRAFATMWGGPDLRYHHAPGATMPTPGPDTGPDAGGPLRHGARIAEYPQTFPLCWRADATEQGG